MGDFEDLAFSNRVDVVASVDVYERHFGRQKVVASSHGEVGRPPSWEAVGTFPEAVDQPSFPGALLLVIRGDPGAWRRP